MDEQIFKKTNTELKVKSYENLISISKQKATYDLIIAKKGNYYE